MKFKTYLTCSYRQYLYIQLPGITIEAICANKSRIFAIRFNQLAICYFCKNTTGTYVAIASCYVILIQTHHASIHTYIHTYPMHVAKLLLYARQIQASSYAQLYHIHTQLKHSKSRPIQLYSSEDLYHTCTYACSPYYIDI